MAHIIGALPQGFPLIFVQAGWGDPSPPALSQLRTWVLGTFLGHRATFFFPPFWSTSKSVQLLFHVYPMFIVLQITISHCSLAAYFGSPVQPPPRVKCKDVIDALLRFPFTDRITKWKRQEAYNDVQKACFTLFKRTNNSGTVRVCNGSAANGVGRLRAVLPAPENSVEQCDDLLVLEQRSKRSLLGWQ